MSSRIKDAFKEDRWVAPYLKRYWRTLFAAVALGAIGYIFAAALMFTSGYMISLAAAIPLTVLALHVPSIFVRIFGIGKPLIQYVERLSNHNWVLKATSSLRVRLYTVLEKRMGESHRGEDAGARNRLGDYLGLLSEDIEHVQDLFLRTIFPLMVMLLLYLAAVVALGVFSWQMGLLLVVVVLQVVVVLPLASIARNGAHLMRVHAYANDLSVKLTDDVLAVSDWRLSGRKADLERRIQAAFDKVHEEEHAVKSSMRKVHVLCQVLVAAFICVLFAWCAYAFASFGQAAPQGPCITGAARALGEFSPHDSLPHAANWIAAFMLCAFPIFEVFVQAPDASLGFVRHEASVQDLNSLDSNVGAGNRGYAGSGNRRNPETGKPGEATPNDLSKIAHPGSSSSTGESTRYAHVDASGLEPHGPCAIEDASSENCGDSAIMISDVSFSYGSRPVLDSVSLSIALGEKVAIMGRSGEGKSTLLRLICGELSPEGGSICVAGRICYIEQHPYIFRKSLRENLLLAKPSAQDDELLEALGCAGLAEFTSNLPDGLDSMLVEGGLNISGGERQRIAVARALLADAPIIILDEPFRGLDVDTERELQRTLFEVFADKTMIVVTHHLLGVECFDRVAFLEEAGMAIDASPVKLARRSERFSRLLSLDSPAAYSSPNS